MRTARFVVRAVPGSVNRSSGRHWSEDHRERQTFLALGRIAITQALSRGEWDGRPFERARVRLTFFWPWPASRRDPTNYLGGSGVKGLLDAFRPQYRAEIGAFPLRDDSFGRIEVVPVDGGVDRRDPRTEISIEELESAGV